MVGGHLYDCTYENAHYAECGMVEGHLYGCTYENAHMRNLSRVWRLYFSKYYSRENFSSWTEDDNIKWLDIKW
jgi:hypothetical protein